MQEISIYIGLDRIYIYIFFSYNSFFHFLFFAFNLRSFLIATSFLKESCIPFLPSQLFPQEREKKRRKNGKKNLRNIRSFRFLYFLSPFLSRAFYDATRKNVK